MKKKIGIRLKSDFTAYEYPNVIAIVDSDTPGKMSVTNDAESVVAWCFQIYGGFEHIIYQDSRGVWDELTFKDGRFDGYKSINETELEKAIFKISGRT